MEEYIAEMEEQQKADEEVRPKVIVFKYSERLLCSTSLTLRPRLFLSGLLGKDGQQGLVHFAFSCSNNTNQVVRTRRDQNCS